MKAPRFTSRIGVRLLAFNLLLVFLPLAGVLYLGAYESRLETSELRSMTDEARLMAATMAREGSLNAHVADDLLVRWTTEVRFRVLDTTGRVVADSRAFQPSPPAGTKGSVRHNTLYRVGAFLLRPLLRLIQPPEAPLEVDFYDNAKRLLGTEVHDALNGKEGFDKKITAGGQRSVTLYRAVPVIVGGRVVGAVLASQSTFTILQDLYVVRLGVLRIFVASLVVAFVVSLFFSTTIVKPVRQLRLDARSILDRRGRIRGHFKGSRRLDEIGELSRALERIMRRLDSHVKFIEQFASDVSHEFKNPLASIRTANEMLAEVSDPADRRRFARMIDQEVARMEKLLSGVREISVIDAQLPSEEKQQIAIGDLLAKIVDGFRLRESERVRFEMALPDDPAAEPVIVEASEERLIQVFENVLDNAVSFSPPGGAVSIATAVDGDAVVTRIADEGPGISEPHRMRIFDRFFTYRPATSWRDSRHTGLGLAIVKAIVEGYGGTITAANVERGAQFEIRLPRKMS
jgi:two-component system, OmpR family, sensor histidine kinase ChvG